MHNTIDIYDEGAHQPISLAICFRIDATSTHKPIYVCYEGRLVIITFVQADDAGVEVNWFEMTL